MNPLKHTRTVLFELSNRCPYARVHPRCPVADEKGKAPVILAGKIVYNTLDFLASEGFAGKICFHTYNEPLIDPRLFQFIKYARAACPKSNIHITTNGWYLNQVILDELAEAGASLVAVSAYFDFEHRRLSKLKPRIEYWEKPMRLDARLDLYAAPATDDRRPCFAPLREVSITREGDVGLCCVEWRRDYTFGNLADHGLGDILMSEKVQGTFKRLSRGDRFLPPCRRCGRVK